MKVTFTTNYTATDVLSLAEAKQHLRIPAAITDEDALHTRMISAACMSVQNLTNRVLGPCTVELTADEREDEATEYLLPISPLSSVVVKYKRADGSGYDTKVLNTDYELSTRGIVPKLKLLTSLPGTGYDRLLIEANAGYSVGAVPSPLKQAVALLVVHMDENRSATIAPVPLREIPFGVMNLVSHYRNEYFTP